MGGEIGKKEMEAGGGEGWVSTCARGLNPREKCCLLERRGFGIT